MSGIDFEGLLLVGVELLSGILSFGIGLRLHNALHVARPAIGGSNESGGGLGEAFGDDGLLNKVLEGVLLEPGGEGSELLLKGFMALLALFTLVDLEAFFGDVLELLAVKLRHSLDAVLIDGLGQVEHFVALLQQTLDERRGLDLKTQTISISIKIRRQMNGI